jgi:ribosomal protein S27E
MPELRCPTCETTADLHGRGVDMESTSRKIVRQGKLGRRPVFKCKVCSAMLVVRSGLLGGISVHQLDVETGVQWDLAYHEHLRSRPAAPPGPPRERTQKPTPAQRAEALAAGKVECPHCGRFLRDDQGLQAHIAAVHGGPEPPAST